MAKEDSARRADLLDKSIEYMLQKGVADLSLRPLAAAVGSKARLLVYHFGSKESLITDAMLVVRERVQQAFTEFVTDERKQSPLEIVQAFWRCATSPAYERYLRLFFEVQGLALQKPSRYGRYLEGATSSWVTMLAAVLPRKLSAPERKALASLAVSTTFGLLLEFLSGGERKRVSRAFNLFLGSFEQLLSSEGRA
ncbi:MAG: TetR/AcrR family transcriptional regulator [Acidobacteria bacterium]|nr:TetR/AcrR family transcriptional regulator [Acidobacteriota bacterium]